GPHRGHHLGGGPLPHAFRAAVAPDVIGQEGLVPGVDGVAHRLADAVVAHRPGAQLIPGQEVELPLAVVVLTQGPPHLEVVAPPGGGPLPSPFSEGPLTAPGGGGSASTRGGGGSGGGGVGGCEVAREAGGKAGSLPPDGTGSSGAGSARAAGGGGGGDAGGAG